MHIASTGVVHARLQDYDYDYHHSSCNVCCCCQCTLQVRVLYMQGYKITITTTITVLVMCVVAASVTDVASLNATNTSITIPEGTKQPANPDSGCGCLLLRTVMLKM